MRERAERKMDLDGKHRGRPGNSKTPAIPGATPALPCACSQSSDLVQPELHREVRERELRLRVPHRAVHAAPERAGQRGVHPLARLALHDALQAPDLRAEEGKH